MASEAAIIGVFGLFTVHYGAALVDDSDPRMDEFRRHLAGMRDDVLKVAADYCIQQYEYPARINKVIAACRYIHHWAREWAQEMWTNYSYRCEWPADLANETLGLGLADIAWRLVEERMRTQPRTAFFTLGTPPVRIALAGPKPPEALAAGATVPVALHGTPHGAAEEVG